MSASAFRDLQGLLEILDGLLHHLVEEVDGEQILGLVGLEEVHALLAGPTAQAMYWCAI